MIISMFREVAAGRLKATHGIARIILDYYFGGVVADAAGFYALT